MQMSMFSEATEGNNFLIHDYLVERAVRWLRNSRKCGIIVTYQFMFLSEKPDAIGWQASGRSFLIECKTSRGDFRRDLRKYTRRWPEGGLGMLRYYLAPPDIIPPEELPENWGLLECHPRNIRTIRESGTFTNEMTIWRERILLLAELRRRERIEKEEVP
jgi:hypothetical protein